MSSISSTKRSDNEIRKQKNIDIATDHSEGNLLSRLFFNPRNRPNNNNHAWKGGNQNMNQVSSPKYSQTSKNNIKPNPNLNEQKVTISADNIRQEALQEACLLLLDRLFHFLSMLPSPDGYDDDDYENAISDNHDNDNDTLTLISSHAFSQYDRNYKSQHPPNNPSTNKNRGLTLPASAIGWLAHALCPDVNKLKPTILLPNQSNQNIDNDDYSLDDDSSITSLDTHQTRDTTDDDRVVPINPQLSDQYALLKWLLRKVTHLKVSSATWPPDPPSTIKKNAKKQKNRRPRNFPFSMNNQRHANNRMAFISDDDEDDDDYYDNDEDDVSISIYDVEDDSSIATNDFSTTSSHYPSSSSQNKKKQKKTKSPIHQLWHQLRSYPRLDMQLFPNLNVLILEGVTPEWIENLHLVQGKLQLLSLERGAIFHLNSFLFSRDQAYLNRNSIKDDSHLGLGPNEEPDYRHQFEKEDEEKVQQQQQQQQEQQDTIKKNDILDTVYPQLTHLKLSNCAIGELSGLLGFNPPQMDNYDDEEDEDRFNIIKPKVLKRGRKKRKKKKILQYSDSAQHNIFQPSSSLQEYSNLLSQQHELIPDQQRYHPPPLSRMSSLQTISLSNNQIIHADTALSGLSSLSQLASIDLSFNYITSMQQSYLKLGNIKTLILSHNKIATVSNGLDRLYSLEMLSLDRNRFEDLQNVVGLANLPFLSRLDLWGNPFMEKDEENYRVNVLSLFVQVRGGNEADLPILDKLRVTQEEKKILEALDFGDIVKVDDAPFQDNESANANDNNNKNTTAKEEQHIDHEGNNDDIKGQKYEIPPLAALDDTDTASSSSSFLQSNYPVSTVSPTTNTSLGRKKVKRLRRRRKAFICDLSNVQDGDGNDISIRTEESFCTIELETRKRIPDNMLMHDETDSNNRPNSHTSLSPSSNFFEDLIDRLSLENPYLFEEKNNLFKFGSELDVTAPIPQDKNDSKDSSIAESQTDDKVYISDLNKEKDAIYKNQLSFLALNIDLLDDFNDLDNTDDDYMTPYPGTDIANRKTSNTDAKPKWIPLFSTDDIDIDDIDINDIDSNDKENDTNDNQDVLNLNIEGFFFFFVFFFRV